LNWVSGLLVKWLIGLLVNWLIARPAERPARLRSGWRSDRIYSLVGLLNKDSPLTIHHWR